MDNLASPDCSVTTSACLTVVRSYHVNGHGALAKARYGCLRLYASGRSLDSLVVPAQKGMVLSQTNEHPSMFCLPFRVPPDLTPNVVFTIDARVFFVAKQLAMPMPGYNVWIRPRWQNCANSCVWPTIGWRWVGKIRSLENVSQYNIRFPNAQRYDGPGQPLDDCLQQRYSSLIYFPNGPWHV